MSDLVSAAAAGKLDPIYLVASDHPILIERALHAVRDAAVPASMRAWNYDVIEGKPTGARIVSACQTLPMMRGGWCSCATWRRWWPTSWPR